MIARSRPGRRGISLIEVLVVVTSMAILLGLCAVTMQALFRVESEAQARRAAASALARLAGQFREDAHSSGDAELRAGAGLRLRRESSVSIDYEIAPGRVTRVETAGGQPPRRESFALGRHAIAAFERRDDGPRRFLALVVRREPTRNQPDPPHPLEILALVGKGRTPPPGPGGARPR
jgi:type II secretory pathway pseudopilin PulG